MSSTSPGPRTGQRDATTDKLRDLALGYYRSGQFALAERHFAAALVTAPQDATLMQLRGLCYYRQNEFSKAMQDAVRSQELDPALLNTYKLIVAAVLRQKRLDVAKSVVQSAMNAGWWSSSDRETLVDWEALLSGELEPGDFASDEPAEDEDAQTDAALSDRELEVAYLYAVEQAQLPRGAAKEATAAAALPAVATVKGVDGGKATAGPAAVNGAKVAGGKAPAAKAKGAASAKGKKVEEVEKAEGKNVGSKGAEVAAAPAKKGPADKQAPAEKKAPAVKSAPAEKKAPAAKAAEEKASKKARAVVQPAAGAGSKVAAAPNNPLTPEVRSGLLAGLPGGQPTTEEPPKQAKATSKAEQLATAAKGATLGSCPPAKAGKATTAATEPAASAEAEGAAPAGHATAATEPAASAEVEGAAAPAPAALAGRATGAGKATTAATEPAASPVAAPAGTSKTAATEPAAPAEAKGAAPSVKKAESPEKQAPTGAQKAAAEAKRSGPPPLVKEPCKAENGKGAVAERPTAEQAKKPHAQPAKKDDAEDDMPKPFEDGAWPAAKEAAQATEPLPPYRNASATGMTEKLYSLYTDTFKADKLASKALGKDCLAARRGFFDDLTVAELKAVMAARNVPRDGLLEKREMVDAVMQTEVQPGLGAPHGFSVEGIKAEVAAGDGLPAAEGKIKCARCTRVKTKGEFSKKQLGLKAPLRTCKACVENTAAEADKKEEERLRKAREEEERHRAAAKDATKRAAEEEARRKVEESRKVVAKECSSCLQQLMQEHYTNKQWRAKDDRQCKACVAAAEAKKEEQRRREEEEEAERERQAAEHRKQRQLQEERLRLETLARRDEEQRKQQEEARRAIELLAEERRREREAQEAKKERERQEKEERRRKKAEAKLAEVKAQAAKLAEQERLREAELARQEEQRAAARIRREELERKKAEEVQRAREEAAARAEQEVLKMLEREKLRKLKEEEQARRAAGTAAGTVTVQGPAAAAQAFPPRPAAELEEPFFVPVAAHVSSTMGDIGELYADKAGVLPVVRLNPRALGEPCKPDEVLNMFTTPIGEVLEQCVQLGKVTATEAETYKRILANYGVDTGQDFLDVPEEAFKKEKELKDASGNGFKGFHPRRIKEVIKGNEEVIRVPEAAMTVYMGKPLGRGASSQVVEGDHGARGRVAVKVIHEKDRNFVEQEVGVLQRLEEHPSIVSFYGHYFYAEKRIYLIVLSRCVLSMRDVVESKAYTVEQLAVVQRVRGNEVRVVQQVYEGMHYLHVRMDYTHRDLKPANVLLDETGHPKIIDFGLAKDLTFDALNNTTVGAGTDGWRLKTQPLGKEADIFSLALVACYFLTSGSHPFGDKSEERIRNLERWERGDYKRLHLGDPLAELLVSQCLVLDPKKRLSIEGCIAHPLFWDGGSKLAFLKAIWEQNQQSPLLKKPTARPWFPQLPALLREQFAGQYGDSLGDQLRLVRVVAEHGIQRDSPIGLLLGRLLDGRPVSAREISALLLDTAFPNLLASVYYLAASGKLAYNK